MLKMVSHQFKVLQSVAATLIEGGRGVSGTPFPNQPEKPIKLYEFEGSPFCRRVREVITLLNLDVEIYPCPKGGEKYRQIVKQKGGKKQFPFLIDENTGDQLYESQDIIHHLFKHYGKTGQTPKNIVIILNCRMYRLWLLLQMQLVVFGLIRKLLIAQRQRSF